MAGIEIISENPITITEVKSTLEEIKKRDKELTPRAMKTYEYATLFGKKKEKEIIELKEKLSNLEISRLKLRHITKIIDLAPKNLETLRILLTAENITLKQEDIEKIIKVIN